LQRDPLLEAAWAGALCSLICFFLGGFLFWQVLNKAGTMLVSSGGWFGLLVDLYRFKRDGGSILSLHHFFLVRLFVPLISAQIVGVLFARSAYLSQKAANEGRHIRGRRYLKDREALREFARISARECREGGEGVRIHPSLPPIPLKREVRHFMIYGSVGSGKTQTITPMMIAAIDRGDRLFVVDLKGDYSALLPGNPLILAPWDSRSTPWDIASDICDKAAAREFAAGIIQESTGSPMWSNSARAVLVGCILKLVSEKPFAWGFADLAELAFCGDLEFFQQTMAKFFLEGLAAVSGSSVTTSGIIINMTSYLSIISDLAEAWPHPPTPGNSFCFRQWLVDDNSPHRTVLLAANGRFQNMQIGLARALLNLASQTISDPSQVGESSTRKLWFYLDEFPQLRDVSSVGVLLEIGRSKGVRVVLGVQDISQLKDIYGPERAKSWTSIIANQIVCQVQPGETAEFVSRRILGDREIERLSTSRTFGQGVGGEAGIFTPGGTATSSTVIETRPVLLPSELTSELGPCNEGVRVLWLGYGDALRLTIPYTTLPPQRPAVVLAEWARNPLRQEHTQANDVPLILQNPSRANQAGVGREQGDELVDAAASHVIAHGLDALLPGVGSALHAAETIGSPSAAKASSVVIGVPGTVNVSNKLSDDLNDFFDER